MGKIPSFQNLTKLYIKEKKSVPEISAALRCSANKINYWLNKYKIPKRTISEAIYVKHNPNGDPFKFTPPRTLDEATLFGIGIGLYWGEGTKADKNTVRLGNTNPILIKSFIKFLVKFFKIKKSDLKFSLQLFTDIKENEALNFWIKTLNINRRQFYKTTFTKSGSVGTYKEKNKYGVLIVYYHNKKLRDSVINLLPI